MPAKVNFEDQPSSSQSPSSPQPDSNHRAPNRLGTTRWATRRLGAENAGNKRRSLLQRMHTTLRRDKRHSSRASKQSAGLPNSSGEAERQDEATRTVYFNQPLPPEMRNEDGSLKVQYTRNKIRTAKYTPLSFVPKNLYTQFHNIANIYFLFIVILNFFPIFGATNPGMNAVPLIVIIVITAIKDAIEDARRTILDNDLNNSPIHRLVDWDNVNISADDISIWRRIKKATTYVVMQTYRSIKGLFIKRKDKRSSEIDSINDASDANAEPSKDGRRSSIRSDHRSIRDSQETTLDQDLEMARLTAVDTDKEIQTLSPTPSTKKEQAQIAPERDGGTLINDLKETSGKARFKRDVWKNVQVGDFVRIYSDDPVPADVVILSTSDHDGGCYIETKSLDGETNLKVRQAMRCGGQVRHARDCEKTEFMIDSEPPHPNLYQYNGAMKWTQRDPADPSVVSERVEPITINNMLLRGCSLRNTEWVLGVVLYTGAETKIMLNSGETPRKSPRLMRDLNYNVSYNFVILFCMCLVSGIVQGVTWSRGNNTYKYFEYGTYGGSAPVNGIITFWAAVILFQNLVPISLYITLEIVRTFQAIFIFNDTYMYYERLDYPCTPKTWNISDDLGQVEYIFSDKTGTLTQNVMEFRKCTINGAPYGEAYTEAQAGMQRRQGIDVEKSAQEAHERISHARTEMLEQLRLIHDNPYLIDDKLTFVSPDLVYDLGGRNGPEQAAAAEHFMLALALCHTVVADREPGDPPRIEFKAQSPDEAALVGTARDCGFTLLGRKGDDLRISVMGEERRYRVLNVLEFNSSRKRMSTIVRVPDGRIILFCKGADSIIYSRLARVQKKDMRKTTASHLEAFASEGLRTLCISERELNEEEYQEWNKRHDEAAAAVIDRDLRLEEVSNEIEQNLTLLGGTAIEDRLQDGVPDTISLLSRAGIKLWVLTGDRVETAINIGFSCNLLNNEMELILVNTDPLAPEEANMASAVEQVDGHLAKFNMTGSDQELAAARTNHEAPQSEHAVIVDGDSLKLLLRSELRQKFLLLCKQCKAVLCCRVSPAQKAAVVELVRDSLDVMALSIGDGANDAAMIQKADVGVGIVGEEGRQAAMSSDYAIGQFKFLQRLVIVHGRWSYRRMGECMANFFYKSLVWTFALFWYSIYNNFDCSYLYDNTYIILVNVAFTSLPVIFLGIFDQDVSDKVSLAVPELYKRGIERLEWSQTKFWWYMLDGFYQSVICFFMVYLEFYRAVPVSANGLDLSDRTRMGVFVACCAVLSSNTYILLNTYRWDWLSSLINIISTLLVWFWTGVYTSSSNSSNFYHAAAEVYGSLAFWVILLLATVLSLAPRTAVKAVQKIFMPLDVDIVREQVSQGRFKYLDKYEAYVPPTAGPSHAASIAELEERPPSKKGNSDSDPSLESIGNHSGESTSPFANDRHAA